MLGTAQVLRLRTRQMIVDTKKNVLLRVKKNSISNGLNRIHLSKYIELKGDTHKAFRGVIHETKLKSLLIEKGLRQSPPKCVRRESAFMAELQLREQFLREKREL